MLLVGGPAPGGRFFRRRAVESDCGSHEQPDHLFGAGRPLSPGGPRLVCRRFVGAAARRPPAPHLRTRADGRFHHLQCNGAQGACPIRPLHLRCDWALDPRTTVFFGAGPGISAALGGGKRVSFGKDDYARFDLQAGVEGGICITGRLAFRAGYDWGLLRGDRSMYARRRGVNAGITDRF